MRPSKVNSLIFTRREASSCDSLHAPQASLSPSSINIVSILLSHSSPPSSFIFFFNNCSLQISLLSIEVKSSQPPKATASSTVLEMALETGKEELSSGHARFLSMSSTRSLPSSLEEFPPYDDSGFISEFDYETESSQTLSPCTPPRYLPLPNGPFSTYTPLRQLPLPHGFVDPFYPKLYWGVGKDHVKPYYSSTYSPASNEPHHLCLSPSYDQCRNSALDAYFSSPQNALKIEPLRSKANFSSPEHVLKPSTSNPGLMTNGENARPPGTTKGTQPPGGPRNAAFNTSAIKKPSPTPSVKRNKANKLIEAHGSPPTFRVTAGGHVVWNDFSLGSPRYPQSAHQRQKYQGIPGPANFAQPSVPNGFVAYAVTPSGQKQLCQWVDGNMLPLHYSQNGPVLYMPSPNFPFPAVNGVAPGFANMPPMSIFPPTQLASVPNGPTSAASGTVDAQIQYLRDRYMTLEREKIEHERKEVHIKDKLPPHERAQMVDRKRHLINELDHVRKMIKGLEVQKPFDNEFAARPILLSQLPQSGYAPPSTYPSATPAWGYPQGMIAPPYPYMPYNSENVPQNVGMPNTVSNAARAFEERVFHHIYEADKPTPGNSNSPNGVSTTLSALALDGQSPSNTSKAVTAEQRRSHAIEIKDPRNNYAALPKHPSMLDPTSPIYEPGKPISPKTGGFQSLSPCTASEKRQLNAQSPSPAAGPSVSQPAALSPRPEEASDASYTTTDFFPFDAHEHSLKRYQACNASSAEAHSAETISYARPYPSTPGRLDQPQSVGYPYGTVLPSPNSPLDLAPPKAPQPSPADDYRTSSFLQDVNASIEAPKGRAGNWGSDAGTDGLRSTTNDAPSRVARDNACQEFRQLTSPDDIKPQTLSEEETKLYTDGFFAGLSRNAVGPDRPAFFVQGYIAGLQQSLTMDNKSKRSMSTLSLKSERMTPTQPPNTAVPSARHSSDSNVDPRLSTEDPSWFSANRDSENIRLALRSPAAYTPTKQNSCGPSPRLKVPSAISAQLRQPLPQRVLSGSLDVESRMRPFFQRDSDGSSEGLSTTSPPRLEGLGAAPSLLTAPLTERSGNESTAVKSPELHYRSKDIQMAPTTQHSKGETRSKTRSTPAQMSMDGALDDLTGLTMPASPCAEPSKHQQQTSFNKQPTGIKSTTTSNAMSGFGAAPPMSPPLKSHSGASQSQTAGCSPKRFSPSKAKATIQNFLHSGSTSKTATEKEAKSGVRSPSPDPANMDPHSRTLWKRTWAQRFADIKQKDKEAKGESPDVAEYKRRNPLPDRVN